jgi:hypothetical protein
MLKAKVSSVRRLGADEHARDPAENPHVDGPLAGQHAARLKWPMAPAPLDRRKHTSSKPQAAEPSSNMRPAAAAQPPAAIHSRPTSKAQALAAFHSAVEGASRARVGLPEQQQEGTVGAPSSVPADGPVQGNAAQLPNAAAAGPHNHPQVQPLQATSRQPHTGVPAGNRSQLLQRATKALQNLQQQLQARTHTYLYQIDGLLQAAHDAVAALNTQLAASSAAAGGPATALMQLSAAGLDETAAPAAATEALHGICCLVWVSASQLHS